MTTTDTMTTDIPRCRRCRTARPDDAENWVGALCGRCCEVLGVVPLRKCSRCRMHVKDWQTTSGYCRECGAAYARERRARIAANPPAAPRLRTCKPCGSEILYPSAEWTANVAYCKPCAANYGRQHRKGKAPLPPVRYAAPGREPMQVCRLCKKYKVLNERNFPNPQTPNKCRACAKKEQRDSRKRLRDREGWVECRECGESKWHPVGGKGWASNRCPDCSRKAENARYHERIKGDSDAMEKRRLQQRDYHRKKVAGGYIKDTSTPQTPAMGILDGKTAKVLELVAEGLAGWEVASKLRMDEKEVKNIILGVC